MDNIKYYIEIVFASILLVLIIAILLVGTNEKIEKMQNEIELTQDEIVKLYKEKSLLKIENQNLESILDQKETELIYLNDELYKYKSKLNEMEKQHEESVESEITINRKKSDVESSDPVYSFSEAERKLFIQVVSAEADSGWTLEGYRYLAQVTVNQWDAGWLGNSLEEVLRYPNNYEVITNGRYLTVPINELAERAVDEVLRGEKFIPEKVQWYCTTEVRDNPFHRTLKVYTQYKNVLFFYKEG